MRPGIYADISNDVYHQGPGISKSGLDLVSKSPAHFRAARIAAANEERKSTASQEFGTAFHMLILEPALFVKTYTLALQKSDVPHAIDDREVLVTMVAKLNEGRLPKLAVGGSKAELIERIDAACVEHAERGIPGCDPFDNDTVKIPDLKGRVAFLNTHRAGILPVSGTRHDLAEILRANGVEVTLWSDVQAEWQQNNAGRIALDFEDWEALYNMRAAVEAHPAARKALRGFGRAELSAYAIDPKTGQLVRVRPDYWRRDGIVIDLKSCDDASREGFMKSIGNWRYHVQHPMYLDVAASALRAEQERNPDGEFAQWVMPRAFLFVAVEKDACVIDGVAKGVAVYALDDASVEVGRLEYRADLETYAECEAAGTWRGYSERVEPIQLAAWRVSQTLARLAA